MSPAELYETDFYQWIMKNAELLRAGRANEADLENIAEELEGMGRSERRELLSRLAVLIAHLLKWQAQPDKRSRSWTLTINLQREELAGLLTEMPSLRGYLEEHLPKAYYTGLVTAVTETHLPKEDFPDTCPFPLEAILDLDFLP